MLTLPPRLWGFPFLLGSASSMEGSGVLLVEGCLHLVEQRDLAVGDLLGLGAVEAHVPELDLLDQGGLLELGLGELGLQRGDDLVGLGGLGAQVLAEVGDLLGERVVLGDEGRALPLHALQQLAHGLYVGGCLHAYIILQRRQKTPLACAFAARG